MQLAMQLAMLFDLLPNQWQEAIPTSKYLLDKIDLKSPFIPAMDCIFAAFHQPISDIKVCIVGQDPYPNPDHAMGLAFSVPKSISVLPRTLSQAHAKIGWNDFTNHVIEHLSKLPVVFILWGKNASEFQRYISKENFFVSAHPSPLSAYRGFFGSKPFTKANRRLIELGISSVDWKI